MNHPFNQHQSSSSYGSTQHYDLNEYFERQYSAGTFSLSSSDHTFSSLIQDMSFCRMIDPSNDPQDYLRQQNQCNQALNSNDFSLGQSPMSYSSWSIPSNSNEYLSQPDIYMNEASGPAQSQEMYDSMSSLNLENSFENRPQSVNQSSTSNDTQESSVDNYTQPQQNPAPIVKARRSRKIVKKECKTGRPFSGSIVNKNGREDKVQQKRAIMRLFSDHFANGDYRVPQPGQLASTLHIIKAYHYVSLKNTEKFSKKCKSCMSYDHFFKLAQVEGYTKEEILVKATTLKNPTKQYHPLIGNVCYRFKRESKETLFKNDDARRLFLSYVPFARLSFTKEIEINALDELESDAILFEEKYSKKSQ